MVDDRAVWKDDRPDVEEEEGSRGDCCRREDDSMCGLVDDFDGGLELMATLMKLR